MLFVVCCVFFVLLVLDDACVLFDVRCLLRVVCCLLICLRCVLRVAWRLVLCVLRVD